MKNEQISRLSRQIVIERSLRCNIFDRAWRDWFENSSGVVVKGRRETFRANITPAYVNTGNVKPVVWREEVGDIERVVKEHGRHW